MAETREGQIHQTNDLPPAYRALIFILFLLFAACLVNPNGGDWDGTQIVLGSLFPAEAAQGYTVLYRPGWQPLTYGILRLVYAMTHSVQVCMFLPAVFGAVGITFLLGAMHKVAAKAHVLLLVGIVLLIPELLFGAIYMNSTVFGFAFAGAALWLAVEDWIASGSPRTGYGRQFLAGGLLALACLCRFDFLLAYPMFLFLLLRARSAHLWGQLMALAIGSVAVCTPAYLGGLLDPGAVVQTIASHEAGSTGEGWFSYTPVGKVLLTIIGANLLAWLTAGAGILYVLRRSLQERRWLDLLGLPALAALLYPALSINSPKYLIPFFLFMALFLAWTLARVATGDKLRPSLVRGVLIVTVALACFLPIHPSRNKEAIVRLTSETWRGTDDGPRSFWGYAFALRELSRHTGSVQWLDPIVAAPDDLVLVAPFDGWVATCSVSQAVVFYLVSHGKKVELGPNYLWVQTDTTRILVAEPGALRVNLASRFPHANKPPRQVPIPLLDVSREEIVLLRCLVQNIHSEAELVEKTHGDREAVHEALRSLVRRDLIEPSDPGSFQLKRRLFELRFYPDPTGGGERT